MAREAEAAQAGRRRRRERAGSARPNASASSGMDTARKCDNRRPEQPRRRQVSEPTVEEATDGIYASLQADNAELDRHIATLKAALARAGRKEAVFDPARLAQSNRQGRKLMQAYFRQRGVTVTFEGK